MGLESFQQLKESPCASDIRFNLPFEIDGGGELDLVAKAVEKLRFDFGCLLFSWKIQQVRLDAKRVVTKSRSVAHVGHRFKTGMIGT